MNAEQQAEYIVQAIREGASMYEEDARKFLAEHDAHVRAEVEREVRAQIASNLDAKAARYARPVGETFTRLAEEIRGGAL